MQLKNFSGMDNVWQPPVSSPAVRAPELSLAANCVQILLLLVHTPSVPILSQQRLKSPGKLKHIVIEQDMSPRPLEWLRANGAKGNRATPHAGVSFKPFLQLSMLNESQAVETRAFTVEQLLTFGMECLTRPQFHRPRNGRARRRGSLIRFRSGGALRVALRV